VYWFRRAVVLGVALGMVFAVAHLLGGHSTTPTAQPVDAVSSPRPSTSAPVATQPAAPTQTAQAGSAQSGAAKATPTPTPLAVPTGPCAARDVQVRPEVPGRAYAGRTVTFRLVLTTRESPACNWQVSPATVVVKLTSGQDRIWSTQDCPAAVPRQAVVVRKDHETHVDVTWRGQRSDGTCSRSNPWAQPGFYYVQAAALGADPAESQFELRQPVPATITPSPTPDPAGKHGKKKARGGHSGAAKPSGTPSASPTR
jgi:hypothetical protein